MEVTQLTDAFHSMIKESITSVFKLCRPPVIHDNSSSDKAEERSIGY